MNNFNNGFPPNNGGNYEDAQRKNRIQQLKLELLKTDDPIKQQQIQEMLDAELDAQSKSQIIGIAAFAIMGIIFVIFLLGASQMWGGF